MRVKLPEEVEDSLKAVELYGCSCDLLVGYMCTIHALARILRTAIASALAAARADEQENWYGLTKNGRLARISSLRRQVVKVLTLREQAAKGDRDDHLGT